MSECCASGSCEVCHPAAYGYPIQKREWTNWQQRAIETATNEQIAEWLTDRPGPLLHPRDESVLAEAARRLQSSRPVASSSHACGESPVRVDGELVLPPNPFGTSATWADYDWRGMARGEEREGDKVAARLCDLIADAVEASS